MKTHPYAALLPMMSTEEFAALKADIAQNGLEPIRVFKDAVIDGRNRLKACKELGVKPRFREWRQDGSTLLSFVTAMNVHRRHLSASQRAAYAVNVLPLLKKEARYRQVSALNKGRKASVQANLPERAGQGQSRDIAAGLFKTSGRYVSDAALVKSKAPKVFARVLAGELTVQEAKVLVNRATLRPKALPAGTYSVIYADPPWQYRDQRTADTVQHWNRAERHYPTMSVERLYAMPVKKLAASDAALFIWVPSPLLAECWPVIRAWGFEYKASFVWDKLRAAFGNYNGVRHEFLLVCTRGSLVPRVRKQRDSIIAVPRARHSEKPVEFRKLIEQMYPKTRRIELFARQKAPGWYAWGNEA